MWPWFDRRSRAKRIRRLLAEYPEDAPLVHIALIAVDELSADQARNVAQMYESRRLSDEEWAERQPRWSRIWLAVTGKGSN